jgi:hypothetical protein
MLEGAIITQGDEEMSKKDKLLERFLSRPKDFSYEETATLMGHYGYYVASGGKTGGSRVSFTDGKGDYIRIHKPHPRNILKLYQLDDIIVALQERGFI